jgi:hypothetical protein
VNLRLQLQRREFGIGPIGNCTLKRRPSAFRQPLDLREDFCFCDRRRDCRGLNAMNIGRDFPPGSPSALTQS